jgi:hypothetical protein
MITVEDYFHALILLTNSFRKRIVHLFQSVSMSFQFDRENLKLGCYSPPMIDAERVSRQVDSLSVWFLSSFSHLPVENSLRNSLASTYYLRELWSISSFSAYFNREIGCKWLDVRNRILLIREQEEPQRKLNEFLVEELNSSGNNDQSIFNWVWKISVLLILEW